MQNDNSYAIIESFHIYDFIVNECRDELDSLRYINFSRDNHQTKTKKSCTLMDGHVTSFKANKDVKVRFRLEQKLSIDHLAEA